MIDTKSAARQHVSADAARRIHRLGNRAIVVAGNDDRIAVGINAADHADVTTAAPTHHCDRANLRAANACAVARVGLRKVAATGMGTGAKAVAVPEKDFTADVDAILKAVTPKTKIVFLANPNNPTGTYVPFDEVKRLQKSLPAHVLLVLDAAYAEYVQRNDYESGIELVATTDNVVMTRTFSKIYGLASLRLGWMYGPAHVSRWSPTCC